MLCSNRDRKPRSDVEYGYGLRFSTDIYGRKRFSTNAYRNIGLFLQKSPKVSENLREFTGECDLGILYSSSLLYKCMRADHLGVEQIVDIMHVAVQSKCVFMIQILQLCIQGLMKSRRADRSDTVFWEGAKFRSTNRGSLLGKGPACWLASKTTKKATILFVFVF